MQLSDLGTQWKPTQLPKTDFNNFLERVQSSFSFCSLCIKDNFLIQKKGRQAVAALEPAVRDGQFVATTTNFTATFSMGVSDDDTLPTTYHGYTLGLAINYHISIPASNSATLV